MRQTLVAPSRALAQKNLMFKRGLHATAPLLNEKVRMTTSEAFVETMVSRDVKDVFGIVGSAFMDSLDLFPSAGIRFISVQHEQNAVHMADGYSRVSEKHGVCIAQNGPGITNFVTGVAAAYWAHSPVVVITPEAGTMTKGLGGFQECDQLTIFKEMVKYQANVNNPHRMAEYTGNAFDFAMIERGPAQLNIPRDYFYGEYDCAIPKKKEVEAVPGGQHSLAQAAELISKAKNPVILSGGGVVMGNGVQHVKKLAEFLSCPVATTYLHNDAFPASHPLMCGPLGYQGSQAAMHCIKEADLVICLGTRLGPFGTNPQYGISYWPENAKVIQVDRNHRNLGLTKPVDVAIQGDAGLAADALQKLLSNTKVSNKESRLARMKEHQDNWTKTLDEMSSASGRDGKMRPRAALRELEKAMPENAMVATDIGNVCSVSNSYLRFNAPKSFLAAMTFGNCGYSFPAAIGAKVARPDRPSVAYVGDGAWGMSLAEVLTCVREKIPTTAVVFNNGQWGAEKKNQVLWFGDRYVGTNLDNPSFANIARAMNAQGVTVDRLEDVGPALQQACKAQEDGVTTVVELMLTRELGDPFRRDAMKLPQRLLPKYKHTSRDSESPTGQPVDL
eukprot:CAMPEP_0174260592 /NCGR_PEP_ID=MMETSP0439-20130205/10000_1 /TAXON_ID=0 /ORGANISM="Stereomyxa ramosa, Strain Chinc5" /LENGTH=615 /DNA_ID=CAMNT_0015344867 /DNA_START=19 /DNA_END=1866 /DNA_ORIENTATION=+